MIDADVDGVAAAEVISEKGASTEASGVARKIFGYQSREEGEARQQRGHGRGSR